MRMREIAFLPLMMISRNLGRFWDESVTAVNEDLKEMLVSGTTDVDKNYKAELQVSKSWDKTFAGKCSEFSA